MKRLFLFFFFLIILTCDLIACRATHINSVATQEDYEILMEAKRLLSEESKWTRNEDTQCDLEAKQWTLFCALQKASYVVTGTYELRRIALEDTRYVVDQMMNSTGLETVERRRLIDFNNHPTTTFSDIQKVLDLSLVRVETRLAGLKKARD